MKKILPSIELASFIGMLIIPIVWVIVLLNDTSTINTDFSSDMAAVGFFVKSIFFMLLEFATIIFYVAVRIYRKRKGEQSTVRILFKKIKKRYIVVGIGIIVIGSFFILIYYGQNLLLYHPNNSNGSAFYLSQRESFRQIEIEGAENEYRGWLYEAPEDSQKTIIYFGGNAESSANTLSEYDFEEWWETFRNYNFLMVDYPGYGLSQGETTKNNLLEMACATLEFVKNDETLNQEIVVMGYSLGSGIATYAASKYQIDKLILLAPYDKMENVYNEYVNIFHGPLKYLVRNDYDSIACAREIALKPLIIASKADEVIPYVLSATLAEGFSNGAEFMTLEGVLHSDFMYQKNVRDKIETFLNSEKEEKSYNKRS